MTEILVGAGLGGLVAAFAFRLFRRTVSGSHQDFLRAFASALALKATVFGGLLLLCWFKVFSVLPAVGSYVAVSVTGTVLAGAVLGRRLRREAARAL